MASTSLAEQLKKLAVPQSSVYKDRKKQASLLFSPDEAAAKDRDTFYEIGLSGLQELIALCEDFKQFEDTLFSISSKDFERAVQSREANKNLDETIEKFLLLLSPYLLLQSSHKALEWLINRYHIHEYNQDEIMQLILPYHETKVFVRFLQITKIKDQIRKNFKWHWLQLVKQHGVALTKQILYNQCCGSNFSLLNFISSMTLRYIEVFGPRAVQLNTVYAFFCSTCIGAINTIRAPDHKMLTAMLPALLKAVESEIPDFHSAGYIVFGFYMTKVKNVNVKLVNELLAQLISSEDLTYEEVVFMNIIFTTQEDVKEIPEEIINNISPDVMQGLCGHINTLIAQKIKVTSLIKILLNSFLNIIQTHSSEYRRYSKLPEMLVEEVDLRDEHPDQIIVLILNTFQPTPEKQLSADESDGGSDLELIEDETSSACELQAWYSALLQKFDRKYPDHFDKAYRNCFKTIGQHGSTSNKLRERAKRKLFSKLLGFKVELAQSVGESTLFEAVHGVHPRHRAEAYNYVLENFMSLKAKDPVFVKECVMRALCDDSHHVVAAALKTPLPYLSSLLTPEELASCFVKVVSRGHLREYARWLSLASQAAIIFCSCEDFPLNQDTALCIMPYMFPFSLQSAAMAHDIIKSPWGQKFELTRAVKPDITKRLRNDNFHICRVMFDQLCVQTGLNFDFLDINQLKKDKLMDVCFFLLLKSHNFKTASAEDLCDYLGLLLKMLNGRDIVRCERGNKLNETTMPEFVNLAMQNKIMFEFIEFIFRRLIADMPVDCVTKPWCDFCGDANAILVKQVFEICATGCSIETYSTNYSALLSSLVGRLCNNAQEKYEFLANFACGNILYAKNPTDVISPELQIRALVLIEKGMDMTDFKKFKFDSDVILISLLFCLNNPLPIIRKKALKITRKIVETKMLKKGKSNYHILMTELLKSEEEIAMDHQQLTQFLHIIFQKSRANASLYSTDVLSHVLQNLSTAPVYVAAELLNVFHRLNDKRVFTKVVPSSKRIVEKMKSDKSPKFVLDIYESKMVRNLLARLDETTAEALKEPEVWNNIESFFNEYRECVLEVDLSQVSPVVLLLKQINYASFKKIPSEKTTEVVTLICKAGTFSGNPKISSAAAKAIKKVHLNFEHFYAILQGMLNVEDPVSQSNQKKKKSSVAMLSYELAETPEWKLGVTILEYVQGKKKMTVDTKFVHVLFQVLNRCLRFEEQSYVEYTKQLVLSSLWFYCNNFSIKYDTEHVKALTSVFEIELVVQCIRNTQNPQTHHHALILLSHAANMLPEQVLHHTMEIFTFMGSSVLRHDDAYSFQIIVKIIETLVPILIKLQNRIEELSAKQVESLQQRVVPVLRIFADAVLHVPEHRRLPLYKKLIDTVGAKHFMWVFLALLLETHMKNFTGSKEKEKRGNRSLADQEAPMNRPDFGQSILLEFSPEACMENLCRLMTYIKTLPMQKDEDNTDTTVKPSDIFSVNGHTAIQLRHYKYVTITFMNSCLSSQRFIQHLSQATNIEEMELQYKAFIINVLTFIQSISKIKDDKSAKYWRVMLHHSYDLLDNTNNLLSVNMFLSVIRGLLKHTLKTVRRKSMELLNSKIQHNPEFFADCDQGLLFSLLPALLDIVKTIETEELMDVGEATAAQELELNQQTALLSLKLLARMLASENPEEFKPVLETISTYACNHKISGNVMASVVLCLAELCGNLKAHALVSLWKFMPALIKVLKTQRQAETPELILLSTVTAVAKIVESLPLFLSPYLQKILLEYSILLAKWQDFERDSTKVTPIVAKLMNIKKKVATCIPPRVLIPVVNQTHQALLDRENYDAIGPVMSVLADSFANVTAADFTTLQQDLVTFFLAALQLRSDASAKGIDTATIDRAEDEVVNALVCLVLKLSESNFRPFYFKVYDWAIRTNVDGQKDRAITFYRLSSAIAEKLKGLFVLFAGHFIKNAADLLDACNNSKSEDLYFDNDEKCIELINSILKTLRVVFLYDSQNFLNKERFETLMQAIVDQLENTVGGIDSLKSRAKELIIPCISQFAVATADDSLWKLLNYQILLKTRHNDAEIRLTALDCLVAMATQLGSSWLPLLAESVPFLAELLEDADGRIENSTKEAIRKLETILGEPLEKYF